MSCVLLLYWTRIQKLILKTVPVDIIVDVIPSIHNPPMLFLSFYVSQKEILCGENVTPCGMESDYMLDNMKRFISWEILIPIIPFALHRMVSW